MFWHDVLLGMHRQSVDWGDDSVDVDWCNAPSGNAKANSKHKKGFRIIEQGSHLHEHLVYCGSVVVQAFEQSKLIPTQVL